MLKVRAVDEASREELVRLAALDQAILNAHVAGATEQRLSAATATLRRAATSVQCIRANRIASPPQLDVPRLVELGAPLCVLREGEVSN